MMFCVNCGKKIDDDFKFCPFCGKNQTPKLKNPSQNLKKRPTRRGNGTGSVYKKGNKYVAEITLGYYLEDGKRKRKMKRKTGFITKKSALDWLNNYDPTAPQTTGVTVSDLYEQYQKYIVPDLSPSRVCAYNIAWNRIKNEVSFRTLDSFGVAELQDIVDSAADTYYTRRDIKTLLSHIYKLAIREDIVSDNKTQHIKLPQHTQTEREVFQPLHIDTMWSDYKKSPSRVTAGILLMLYTGIRAGELLTISTENVHMPEHYMTGGIKTAKGKRRKIIIPDAVTDVLRYLLDTSEHGLICYYKIKNDFYDAWQLTRARLGLPDNLTPYCCRHTYITNLTAAGVSPAMLQELVGHEDYETTLNYTHLSVDDRLDAVNQLYKK